MSLISHNVGASPSNYQPGNWINSTVSGAAPNVGANPTNYQPGNWVNTLLPANAYNVGTSVVGAVTIGTAPPVWALLSPDTVAPVVQNTNPSDLDTGVLKAKVLTLQVVDLGAALNPSSVRIYVEGNLAYDGSIDAFVAPYNGGSSAKSAVTNGFQFDINKTTQWGSFGTVSVQVQASDTFGNTLNTTYSFQIEDYGLPTISNNLPTGTGVLRTSAITFKTEDISESGIDQSTMDVSIGGADAILAGVFQAGWSGTIIANANNGYDVTINKTTDHASYASVTVNVSVDDNSSNNAALNWSFQVEDYLGPLISPTAPTSGQINVATSTNIVVTITDEQAVDLNTVRVLVDDGGGFVLAYEGGGSPAFKPGWDGAGSALTGGPTSYTVTIDKVSTFVENTAITVKVIADDTAANPERL